MPVAQSTSLFASDYSLSTPTSPASGPPSPQPFTRGSSGSLPKVTNLEPDSPAEEPQEPLAVIFKKHDEDVSNLPTPPASPARRDSAQQATHEATRKTVMRKKSSFMKLQDENSELLSQRKGSGTSYATYDACMEGGLGHETKAATYPVGTEKAYHHLGRANDLFINALHFKPSCHKAMLSRAKVLTTLATHYQPPFVAARSLKESTGLLREILMSAPSSLTVREALVTASSLHALTLHETDDSVISEDATKVWDGKVGQLSREALSLAEDVASAKMDKMKATNVEAAAALTPALAETFLLLASTAIEVSKIAPSLADVESHLELADQALDQASNMASVAQSHSIRSSSSSVNLLTRIQLLSGGASLERLRHTFILGSALDEDEFRNVMTDMNNLCSETRDRVKKLKGSKAAAATTLAYEAVKMYGDAKALYASLLRLVWRKRKVEEIRSRKHSLVSNSSKEGSRRGSQVGDGHLNVVPEATRRASSRKASSVMDAAYIIREDEELDARRPSVHSTSGESAQSDEGQTQAPSLRRKSSQPLAPIPDGRSVTSFTSPFRGSMALPSVGHGPPSPMSPGRKGSWLPTSSEAHAGRGRRQSSMSQPLVGPDGISAWTRKASVITLAVDEEAEGLVSSAQLALSAWQLLESAVKQHKLALNLLSATDLAPAPLARAKSDVLHAIANSSLFMATLSSRVPIAAEKKTSLLATAEIYATWAAREVGWSFLIEGTQEAKLADRRTNSWRADESGKRAVMTLVRIWWYRAVTSERIDVDTKLGAKDAVERVVKRMKDHEGVRDGDVVRFRVGLANNEGEMDAAEVLFWRSVSRILRGGAGFVMS